MKHSDQGIVRTERGEEQPADAKRASLAPQTGNDAGSPSKQATRKNVATGATRSGHSSNSNG